MAKMPFLVMFLLAATCLVVPLVSEAVSQSNEDCLTCHSKEGGAPPVDISLLKNSVHRTIDCVSCHSEASVLPHTEKMKPVNCGSCHSDILAIFQRSVHGQALEAGIYDVPDCKDCHGEHLVLSPKEPSSLVYPLSITKTCGRCHEDQRIATQYRLRADVVRTYEQSYHGLAARYGSIAVANCASCHGSHGILSSGDPASSINKANLSATCRKCHPGAGVKLASGYVHSTLGKSKNTVVRYVVIFYLLFITLVIGGMFLHNLADFVRKLAAHFQVMKNLAITFRFVLSERLQHIALTVTFIVLAYSGFARRFPESWWTSPFRLFDSPADVRALVHRVAAGFFIALCACHVWFIFLTRRGKEQLNELKPRFQDFKDLTCVAKYNIGISKNRPEFKRFSYIEKSEYWALVWGSVIMIITGLALVFVNVTLKYFPLWVSELVTAIHFYEAILATLAIAIWHLYWTIFDPNVYPMNWSWITGRSAEKRAEGPVPEKRGEKRESKRRLVKRKPQEHLGVPGPDRRAEEREPREHTDTQQSEKRAEEPRTKPRPKPQQHPEERE
jgi:cytochrome b subunit of formate dehydrogenase